MIEQTQQSEAEEYTETDIQTPPKEHYIAPPDTSTIEPKEHPVKVVPSDAAHEEGLTSDFRRDAWGSIFQIVKGKTPDQHDDPRKFSQGKKALILFIIASAGLIAPVSSTTYVGLPLVVCPV